MTTIRAEDLHRLAEQIGMAMRHLRDDQGLLIMVDLPPPRNLVALALGAIVSASRMPVTVLDGAGVYVPEPSEQAGTSVSIEDFMARFAEPVPVVSYSELEARLKGL